jgi:glycine/D-amino acid oxidase-like deaminating enzyme
MYPHVKVGDVTCACTCRGDGQCDPANIAMALAKGARMRGEDHRGGEGHRRHR